MRPVLAVPNDHPIVVCTRRSLAVGVFLAHGLVGLPVRRRCCAGIDEDKEGVTSYRYVELVRVD